MRNDAGGARSAGVIRVVAFVDGERGPQGGPVDHRNHDGCVGPGQSSVTLLAVTAAAGGRPIQSWPDTYVAGYCSRILGGRDELLADGGPGAGGGGPLGEDPGEPREGLLERPGADPGRRRGERAGVAGRCPVTGRSSRRGGAGPR